MTGKEAFEVAFERLFETALRRFHAECTTEEREEAKKDFAHRFAPQLKFLGQHLRLEQFPEEIVREIEEKILHLPPAKVAQMIASAPLIEQMQAALQTIAAKEAKEHLLEHLLTQVDAPYGGH